MSASNYRQRDPDSWARLPKEHREAMELREELEQAYKLVAYPYFLYPENTAKPASTQEAEIAVLMLANEDIAVFMPMYRGDLKDGTHTVEEAARSEAEIQVKNMREARHLQFTGSRYELTQAGTEIARRYQSRAQAAEGVSADDKSAPVGRQG